MFYWRTWLHCVIYNLHALIKHAKENKIYCFDFLRNGYHVFHPKDQYDLNKYIEFSDQIREDCEDLI